jgi:hypothetical protein
MKEQPSRTGSLTVGLLLILLGVLFLVDDYLGIDLGQLGWPLFIIVPGVAIYLGALLLPHAPAKGLSAAGSIITMVGLILFFQNSFGYYQSWAYAWALVAPTSFGLGWMGLGLLRQNRELAQEGMRLAGVGVVLFLAFGAFFELVIGISGFRQSWAGNLWPALLIILGLFLLARNYWTRPPHKVS